MSHPSHEAVPPDSFDLDRLRLRRPVLSDAGAMFECGSDPEVARYANWPVCTDIGPTIERLKGSRERWESGSEFYWCITLPADDRAIGAISCFVEGHAAEFGYLVNRRHWGNGYATEAARAIVRWAMSQPAIWRLWATCDVENAPSIRVLEKAGLSREGTLRRAVIRPNLSAEPRDAHLYSTVR